MDLALLLATVSTLMDLALLLALSTLILFPDPEGEVTLMLFPYPEGVVTLMLFPYPELELTIMLFPFPGALTLMLIPQLEPLASFLVVRPSGQHLNLVCLQ
jgi:hypothetical protein